MGYGMKNDKWHKLGKGDYTLNTWVGEDQLTYRIVHLKTGWVLSRQVAGAGLLVLTEPKKTLREAQSAAEADRQAGL